MANLWEIIPYGLQSGDNIFAFFNEDGTDILSAIDENGDFTGNVTGDVTGGVVGPVVVPTGDTAVIADADALTVGGVIIAQSIPATMHAQAAADQVSRTFFNAIGAWQLVAVSFIAAVAEATAGSLSVQITKDTGTDAPGAGTVLLTNNTNAGFNAKATANTIQTGTLTATAASLQLATGNRLSAKYSDAATELVGVTITAYLKRI
jgi:hypothetical protein